MGRSADDRWVEVSPSQFPHEAEGLALVRSLLPDQGPFRAWSNFEFRDSRGRWHEVDLLVLGRRQFHLVELKSYAGTLRGDDHTWLRDGKRAEESPLKLARRKAQYFKSKINDEFHAWVRERKTHSAPPVREVVPYVQESIFLHHPSFRSELSEASAIGLWGIDGSRPRSNLPGISDLLLEPGRPDQRIHEAVLVELMKRIGLVQRRDREAGSWVIHDEPVAEGDGWQEWDASHKVSQEERGRIRFQIAAPGSGEAEQRRVRRIAEHEFRVMSRLTHDGLLRPRDIVESDLGVGLVYPYDEAWQRLDLWLADQPTGVSLDIELSIVRQVGEALQYAHGNRVVHRALSPQAVWVRERHGTIRVQVRDWQDSGQVRDEQTRTSALVGVTGLLGAQRGGVTESDTWLTDGFAAPEGAMVAGVDRVRVDVFALGALTFYLLANQPAARSAVALRSRLREQSGLDLGPEVPQISSALRAAVLDATRPAVSQRTANVASFLAQLSVEEARDTDHEPVVDPVDAAPNDVLDGRFRLRRRLGSGSTAVGLLVSDLTRDDPADVVLKVALDDSAGERLSQEAEVLAGVRSPRLVALLEGPLTVGGRQALLLESAGTETLAQAISGRDRRLSLDLLERWGNDLLEALVALDRAGVDHRDIKPANLGVRESRSNRTKHLVLFDFSLSRAAASALRAGTPPYLDPFLGGPGRDRYDSAAERYAAAVVLFEMATGSTPRYGDGLSDAAAIPDRPTVTADQFDPSLGQALVTFFRRALARELADRHDTMAEMAASWQLVFSQTETGAPANAEELAGRAGPSTLLGEAGLSARALSALEPFGVRTVADLAAVDAARLSRLSGIAVHTRADIRTAASLWRTKFGRSYRRSLEQSVSRALALPGPLEAAELLMDQARTGRARNRPALVSLVLGVTGDVDGFATQAQLGAQLPDPVGAARAGQLVADLQESWATHQAARELLDTAAGIVAERLSELGGVATVAELADHLLTQMVAEAESEDAQQGRIVAGLIRLIVDRQRALIRGAGEGTDYAVRRRDGKPVVLSTDLALLDVADTLGPLADRLVDEAVETDDLDAVVPPARVSQALAGALKTLTEPPERLRDPARLTRLAASLSDHSMASGIHELHHRELSAAAAIGRTLNAVGGTNALPPAEVRDRVRARFPGLRPLPERPQLDQLMTDSGLGLSYDERTRAYRAPRPAHATTGLESRLPTALTTPDVAPISARGVVGQRLADSLARRSFLALGVPAVSLDKVVTVLTADYDAQFLDLTDELLTAMRAEASTAGVPWATVLAGDAHPTGSRDARGVAFLVGRALPVLEGVVDAALAGSGSGPLVLTDAAPLARYGAVGRLSRWTDLSLARARALWLVVPQLHANHGPLLDQRPLPLAAPGQYVPVDEAWVNARLQSLHPPVPEGQPT